MLHSIQGFDKGPSTFYNVVLSQLLQVATICYISTQTNWRQGKLPILYAFDWETI